MTARVLHPPLVGRALEMDLVVRAFASPAAGSLVLAGPAGVGKTRLANDCLAIAVGLGLVPLRVSATRGASALPFGAFASVVPDLTPTAGLPSVLRRISEVITQRGEGRPVIVLVDDAHLLDDPSAALVHLLARQEMTRVLITFRTGEPAPDPVVALWKDGIAQRIDLHPLAGREVADLLGAVLRGPVDRGAVHLLHQRTEGNPLFLREVLLSALEAGVLHVQEGVWRLNSGVFALSDRLVELIESRLGVLAEPVRQALGLLAFSEPLEVDLFSRADETTDLADLERRGLVRVVQDGRRLVARLPHPLYAEVLRARMSRLRARAAARALAGAVQAVGCRRREDALRLGVWSLEAGGPLQPGLMLAAATQARQRHDLLLAERLARAASGAGAGFEASLLLGQVCWLQGRSREALDHFEALRPVASTDPERAQLAMARISVLDWGLMNAGAAVQVAEEAEAAIEDVGYRDQITAERARILGRSGRHTEAIALATPLLGRVSGGALVSACFAAGTSMCVSGQVALAVEVSQRGLAAHSTLTGPPLPFGPYLHLVIRCKALVSGGRLVEARALADAEYEKAVAEGSLEAQSFFAFELARGVLEEGRAATAASIAAESAGAFRQLRWHLWTRNALACRAHALALLGEAAAAREMLTELDALGVPATELLGPEVLQARAWTEVAGGDTIAGRRYLRAAAAMALDSGAHALESAALHDLARLGLAAEVAARLAELAGLVEGPLSAARAVHAGALASSDGPGLEASAESFEVLGAVLLAAEAFSDAAVVARRRGEVRRSAGLQRRSVALAGRCEGARTPALSAPTSVRAHLTPRELEIARLAAGGLANKEIATRLFLSHRTVENRLHSAYEKLGVSRRADLRKALGGPDHRTSA